MTSNIGCGFGVIFDGSDKTKTSTFHADSLCSFTTSTSCIWAEEKKDNRKKGATNVKEKREGNTCILY
jgi:hypothetical protein